MVAFLLGLDVGTSRTKAALVDQRRRVVHEAATATPFVTTGDRVEMGVDELHGALASVLSDLGNTRAHVAGVGVAGVAESGAPLDTSGCALAPVIAWHDGRGEEAVAVLDGRFGPDLSRRIGQPVRVVLTAAKLGWLVAHGLRGAVRWLGVPELCLHALTGSEATEFSLAARTGCYDVAARAWMPEVAEALGFSTDLFPEVRPAGAVMGWVSPDGAAWSGLPPGTPVTVAGHDHLAGMAGAGVGPREWGNSVGTAETVVARSPAVPDLDAARDLHVAVTVLPGGEEWAALVSAARAGIVVETAADALGSSPEELDRLAQDASPADMTGAVDTLAGGEPAPLPDASPGEIWAGLLDALVARTADACNRLAPLTGVPEAMVVFGGGSFSEPWWRAKEARLEVPLRRLIGTSTVARGAAVHAGVAAGWWPSADEAAKRASPTAASASPPSTRATRR